MQPTKVALLCAALTGAPLAYSSEGDFSRRCADLKNADLYHTQLKSADYVENGVIPADPNSAITGSTVRDVKTGAHCVVKAEIEPRTGANGLHYGINYEFRLPQQWNGKFLFQGGGGANGFVAAAVGSIPSSNSSAKSAIERGYAVVSMDSGHATYTPGIAVGSDMAFAGDQQARLDYAYAAIGKVTQQAKTLINALYQKKPIHSYFMGCSNGGREAMIAAQRYPNEFDGVVVGNAAFRLSRASINSAFIQRALVIATPADTDGQKNTANLLTADDLRVLQKGILKQCDAKDGLEDDIINAWEQCDFRPDMVEKELGKEKAELVKTIFSGARNNRGEALYSAFPYHSSLTDPEWIESWFGKDFGASSSMNATLMVPFLLSYFSQPAIAELAAFDFDRDVTRTQSTRSLTDADSPDLSTFRANGGKMVIFEGTADPFFSAFDQRDWFIEMDQIMGNAQEFARLFTVPGLAHCSGGNALDDFDPLTTLENWREKGEVPEFMLAKGSKFFAEKTQPVCAYPKVAMYKGGDKNKAQSFECR
ncbi:tannase/feruloyl esterase family alpha/beta hydrolase [Pseudomonas sp. H11T01]|uniref:tannase/feruloyl esterase family alpha/beta hydrolase n=1 Tax=Pseudomonas sp. H11T01 TaxID=3402749 RepID=UPI003AD34340